MNGEEWKVLSGLAGSVTGTTVLLAGLWAILNGRLKTDKHHKEVVDTIEKSEARAWGMVDKLTEARADENAVLEKLAGSVHEVTNTVEALRQAIEYPRQRR